MKPIYIYIYVRIFYRILHKPRKVYDIFKRNKCQKQTRRSSKYGNTGTSILSCHCKRTEYYTGCRIPSSLTAYSFHTDQNMEEELGKQLLIRGTKCSRKVTLTEEGMILRKRAEEILDLVKKTEHEITCSDNVVIGDVYIGAGETDGMRLLAKASGNLKKLYPGIHYHISSGNAVFVKEQLDKGLIDFGIIFGTPDTNKYEALKLPSKDIWGVLMRKDAPWQKKNLSLRKTCGINHC